MPHVGKQLLGKRTSLDLGLMVSRLLAGSWRDPNEDRIPTTNFAQVPTSNFARELDLDDLAAIVPLLCQSGAGALAWWQIRDTELAVSAAGEALHQVYRRHRLSALLHEQEIKTVLSLLAQENIEPVLVKGWAIARRYPDPALRTYGDIDLCMRPDQFEKAERALVGLANIDGHFVDLHRGFERLAPQVFRVPTSVGWFRAPKNPTEVGTLNTCNWDELFKRSQIVMLGETAVRVLGEEDHLRLLCLHLLRSGAWRPPWLCDVALAVETHGPDFDWEVCLGRDPLYKDWVECAIGLAQQLLGASGAGVPDARDLPVGGMFVPPVNIGRMPLPNLPPLPLWLVPAVLRQWGRPARASQMNAPGSRFKELYWRWDNPVRATARLRGEFNNWPRLPYRLGEMLLRIPESPKQLRRLVRMFAKPSGTGVPNVSVREIQV